MIYRLLPLALALLAGGAQAQLLKDPQWQAWLDAGKSGELARAAEQQTLARIEPVDTIDAAAGDQRGRHPHTFGLVRAAGDPGGADCSIAAWRMQFSTSGCNSSVGTGVARRALIEAAS